MIKINHDDLIFLPLGGSGEIGMNANLYHYKGRWLMIDLGISFPDDTMPGVDVVLPDLRFIEERAENLEAIILTHAHEDHFGAIPYLWERLQVPVYGTAFTLALLRRKLAEARLDVHIPMHEIDYNIDYNFGPFSIELVSMTHSIPDPAALILRTPEGVVFHTGDWKFDATPMLGEDADKARLRALGDEGVMALIGDSTNAMVAGHTPSEAVACAGLTKVIAEAENMVAVTCFASNVARIESIITAASANNRSVCVAGRALNRTISAAKEVGYLRDIPDFVSESDASLIPRENLVVICTGSQGESRAAMARIANGMHEQISLNAGDTVIFSSRKIPGNEQAIGRVQDALLRGRVHLITDEEADVHVSGHPSRDELTEMYSLIRPKIAIPVHGTARHLLAHAELAENCQVAQTLIPENGDVVKFNAGKAEIEGQAHTGLLTHEGGEIVDLQSDFLRVRRRMLWNGTVTISVVLSGAGHLLMAPQISQSGLCSDQQEDDFIADASLAVEDALVQHSEQPKRDNRTYEQIVTGAVRSLAKQRFRLRPTVHAHILQASDEELRA
ncbi:MAG: ribonuclease J [Alphaproteobacteria bacterium]|nr:ribonuclease J [Alphaproteobacteria bacterium]